ncbi:MAG: anti-sigma factor [Patescibacteria group bacterium]|nr:anti-sigma factor [Candidatus Beckwithbacteria bacterium]MDZ4228727.1 anti-sigma factor [Patescibacteria group bacterium]
MFSSSKQLRLVLGIVVVLSLVGGGYWLINRNQPAEEMVSPEITLEPTQQMTTELVPPMAETEKQVIEDAFAKEGAEMTLLKDVTGGQAVGTAWRQYDGSTFYHKAEVTNLAALEKGFFYEGWLVGEAGFFSTGRMAAVAGKGELYYKVEEDKSGFRGVVITLESEDGDPSPEKHILEGSF